MTKIDIILILTALLTITGLSISHYTGREDNIIEEIAEELIEDLTNVEVDLTPDSVEV